MRRIVIIAIAAFLAVSNALAEEGVWIRYPGDYEMWLGSDVQSRRIEHGTPCGVFWPEYSHWPQVTFEKEVNLEKPERIRVEACGDAYIQSPGMVFTDAEGCATILWKDASRAKDAAELLRLTASDLLRYGAADEILPEKGKTPEQIAKDLKKRLTDALKEFDQIHIARLLAFRYERYRRIGAFWGRS